MPVGIPAAVLISSLVGAGTSVAGAALSSKKKQQTSTTTPTLSPELQALQQQLMSYSGDLMSNPSKGLQPMKTAGADKINRRYAAMPGKISQNMASRGYGSSGDFGNTMFQTEFARSGEMSDLESLFSQMTLDRQDRGAQIGQNLLAQGSGSTTTGTIPGDSAGSALQSAGNGLGNLSTLMMLSKILKQ
jgi:hypothetical protein